MSGKLPPTFPPPSRGGAPEFAQYHPVHYLPGSDHVPASIASEEENALRASSPPLSLWPKLDDYEGHSRRVNERRTELVARREALQDEINRAEVDDRAALAEVALDAEAPRPEPRAPRLRQGLEEIQREQDALSDVQTKVLKDKWEYVDGHRGKMLKEAEAEADKRQSRYLALVAELEQAREQLGKARQTMLWVGSYGTPAASSSIPSGSLIAGLAGPTRRIFGLEQQLSAEAIFRGLREDANVLRTIGTPEQLEALGKRVRKREAQWQEGNPDFVGPRFDAAWAGSPEEAAAAERVNRYAEAVRKRLWGE